MFSVTLEGEALWGNVGLSLSFGLPLNLVSTFI